MENADNGRKIIAGPYLLLIMDLTKYAMDAWQTLNSHFQDISFNDEQIKNITHEITEGRTTAEAQFDQIQHFRSINRKHQEAYWQPLQVFLVFAGNASKVVFPDHRGSVVRGKELRRILGIADDSPLNTSSRRLRNCLEHFDERMDKLLKAGDYGLLSDKCDGIGDFGICDSEGEPLPLNQFRAFNRATMVASFQGEKFHLPPIHDALVELRERSEVQIQEYWRNTKVNLPSWPLP
ncbi:hypothetical protein [Singulisphaera sp. PoT]|uniref:hypothetical protein n=1 Tax=Singulisphaera sp. PoT TaxID=3411797 RepID=UPI003BF4B3A2